jgi:hypothetical protein
VKAVKLLDAKPNDTSRDIVSFAAGMLFTVFALGIGNVDVTSIEAHWAQLRESMFMSGAVISFVILRWSKLGKLRWITLLPAGLAVAQLTGSVLQLVFKWW